MNTVIYKLKSVMKVVAFAVAFITDFLFHNRFHNRFFIIALSAVIHLLPIFCRTEW